VRGLEEPAVSVAISDKALWGVMASDPVESFRLMTGDDPLEWQVPYLREWRDCAVLKGRQVGASTSGASKAVRKCFLRGRTLAAIVSPSLKQSTEVKERARSHCDRLGVKLARDSESVIEFPNGSRIMSLPGTAKSVRGWSADLLILDEAAYLDKETFLAARATVAATGGQAIVQSTPESPYGHFYEFYSEAVDYLDSFLEDGASADPTIRAVRFRVSSEDVPTISRDFLDSERKQLNDDDYAREYLGRFGAPGAGIVNPDRLKSMTPKDAPSAEDFWAKLRGS
jgi:hypothetical protein